jgi:hypothetical protein
LAEGAGASAIGRGLQGLAIRMARSLNRHLGSRGRVFADRYHARALGTPREVRNALRYVLLNARHHGASADAFDSCSSSAAFDGWKGVHVVSLDTVVAPRSWLLRIGWRRHGPIDPRERP